MSNPDLIGNPAEMLTDSPSQAIGSSAATTDQSLLQPKKSPVEVILANANINPDDYPFVLSMEDLQGSDNLQVGIFLNAIQASTKPDGLKRILSTVLIQQFDKDKNLIFRTVPENSLSDDPSSSKTAPNSANSELKKWFEEHGISDTFLELYDHGLHALPEGPIQATLRSSFGNQYGYATNATSAFLTKNPDATKTIMTFSADGHELYVLRKSTIVGAKIAPPNTAEFNIAISGNIYTLIKCTATVNEEGKKILISELATHATDSELFKNMYLDSNGFVFDLKFDSETLSLNDALTLVHSRYTKIEKIKNKVNPEFLHQLNLEILFKKIDSLRFYAQNKLPKISKEKIARQAYRALKECDATIKLVEEIYDTEQLYAALRKKVVEAYNNVPENIKMIRQEIYDIYSDVLSHASRSQNKKAKDAMKKAETLIKLLTEISDTQIKITNLRQVVGETPASTITTIINNIERLQSFAIGQVRKGTELNQSKAEGALKAANELIKLTHACNTDKAHENENADFQARYADEAILIIEQHKEQIASSRFVDWIFQKLSSLLSFGRSNETAENTHLSTSISTESRKRKRSLFETKGLKLTEDAEDSILVAKKQLLSSARILSLTATTSSSTHTGERSESPSAISHPKNDLEDSLSIGKNGATTAPSVSNTTSSESSSSKSSSCTSNSTTLTTGPAIHFVKELPDQTELTSGKYRDSYIITENDNYEKTISYISTDNKIDGPFSIYGLPEEFSKKLGITYLLDGKQSKALNYYLLDAQKRDLERELLNTAKGSSHEIARFRNRLHQSLNQGILPEEIIRRYNENKDGIIFEPNAKKVWEKYVLFDEKHGKFIKEYEAKTELLTNQNAVRKRTIAETDLENELNPNNRPYNRPIVEFH